MSRWRTKEDREKDSIDSSSWRGDDGSGRGGGGWRDHTRRDDRCDYNRGVAQGRSARQSHDHDDRDVSNRSACGDDRGSRRDGRTNDEEIAKGTGKGFVSNGDPSHVHANGTCSGPGTRRLRSLDDLMKADDDKRSAARNGICAKGCASGSTSDAPATNNFVGGAVSSKTPGTNERTIGTLTKFFKDRGFGFIKGIDSSGDAFLHVSDLRETDGDELVAGMKVQYECEYDARTGGTRAKDVINSGFKMQGGTNGSPDHEANASTLRSDAPSFIMPDQCIIAYSPPESDALNFDYESWWAEPNSQGQASMPTTSQSQSSAERDHQQLQSGPGSVQRSPNRGLKLSEIPGFTRPSDLTIQGSSVTTHSGAQSETQSTTQSSASADDSRWWTFEDAEASAMKLIEEELRGAQ